MGVKSKKEGKRRRVDKFYTLAKEQGYRARSAFKLIQLDKKYNFLSTARGAIRFCVALRCIALRCVALHRTRCVGARVPRPPSGCADSPYVRRSSHPPIS